MTESTEQAAGMPRGALLLICALAIPYLHPPGARALETFRYQHDLTESTTLVRPAAVSFASESNSVCVTEEGSRAISVFDVSGLLMFRTDGASGISVPRDACIDQNGAFVLIDTDSNRGRTIKRLSFLGEPESFLPQPPRDGWHPVHLTLSPKGHYVTLDRSGLLALHDRRTGALLWDLDLADPTSDRSDIVARPSVSSDGRIFVPRPGLRSVLVVSADGRRLAAFGVPGAKRGELTFPVGVAFAPGNRILVLDRMRHKVLVFDDDFEFQFEFAGMGTAPGELYQPVAITSSPDGQVFIAQGFEGRIQVFRILNTVSTEGEARFSQAVTVGK